MPVLFAFHGLAFNLTDEWLRANGERDVVHELRSLKESIGAMELQLTTQGQAGLEEFQQKLTGNEIKDLGRQIKAHRERCERLSEKLQQRESDRKNSVWNGLLRATPATLHLVAVRGHAPFPHLAYDPNKHVSVVHLPKRRGSFLEGHLLVLEDAMQPVGELTVENLHVSMIDVKAVEAANASVSDSEGRYVPEPSETASTVATPDVAEIRPSRHAWVAKAQEIGAAYLEKHKMNDLFPSQQNVADHVAKILKSEHVLSDLGKPLSSGYILRNALQGAWWKRHAR
jgi:hypothetical protein